MRENLIIAALFLMSLFLIPNALAVKTEVEVIDRIIVRQLTDDIHSQIGPSVCGRYVVWSDLRNISRETYTMGGTIEYHRNSDIYLYDLTQNQIIPVAVDPELAEKDPLVIDGKVFYFAYQRFVKQPNPEGSNKNTEGFLGLYMYDIAQNETKRLLKYPYNDISIRDLEGNKLYLKVSKGAFWEVGFQPIIEGWIDISEGPGLLGLGGSRIHKMEFTPEGFIRNGICYCDGMAWNLTTDEAKKMPSGLPLQFISDDELVMAKESPDCEFSTYTLEVYNMREDKSEELIDCENAKPLFELWGVGRSQFFNNSQVSRTRVGGRLLSFRNYQIPWLEGGESGSQDIGAIIAEKDYEVGGLHILDINAEKDYEVFAGKARSIAPALPNNNLPRALNTQARVSRCSKDMMAFIAQDNVYVAEFKYKTILKEHAEIKKESREVSKPHTETVEVVVRDVSGLKVYEAEVSGCQSNDECGYGFCDLDARVCRECLNGKCRCRNGTKPCFDNAQCVPVHYKKAGEHYNCIFECESNLGKDEICINPITVQLTAQKLKLKIGEETSISASFDNALESEVGVDVVLALESGLVPTGTNGAQSCSQNICRFYETIPPKTLKSLSIDATCTDVAVVPVEAKVTYNAQDLSLSAQEELLIKCTHNNFLRRMLDAILGIF